MHTNSIANLKKGNAAPRCSYTRLNDQPCTQPALHGQTFCRFHDLVDHPLPDARQIPFVEDATTLQLALMQVIKSLQLGQIDRRTAGTILYALQIAASNLKHFCEENGHPFAPPAPRKTKKEQEEEEALAGPSLAEYLIEQLNLRPPENKRAQKDPVILSEDGAARSDAPSESKDPVFPPCSSVPSVVNDAQSPTRLITQSHNGGVVDKLEACVARSTRRHRRAKSPDHEITRWYSVGCPTLTAVGRVGRQSTTANGFAYTEKSVNSHEHHC